MSLRARTLLATIALATTGVLVADFATYHFLSTFLVDRVDQQLRGAALPVANRLLTGGSGDDQSNQVTPPGTFTGARQALLPTGTYAAVVDRRGRLRQHATFSFGQRPAPPPQLPQRLPGTNGVGGAPITVTVAAIDGFTNYRLLARALPGHGSFVIAIPLSEVAATQHQLLLIEVAVTAVVLLSITAAGLWLVRHGLRPLQRMADTAAAIAAGDLSQRVQPNDPRSEIGKLGAALNAMLAQIEQGFDERRAAEQRLRQFLADASHELRSPVTSIRGYAELFRRGAADHPEDLALVMRRIEEEGARMGELVEDMLLLARLDQGLPLERTPVNLSEIATAAVEAARAAIPTQPISLNTEDSVIVTGAANRLRQVIDNLLANAHHHTPAQTPVHVRLFTTEQHAHLDVGDEGHGVPAAQVPRLFERFYRADRARSRSQGNLGLGLAITASIVVAHHGRISYAPREGGGALFHVVLPLAPNEPTKPVSEGSE